MLLSPTASTKQRDDRKEYKTDHVAASVLARLVLAARVFLNINSPIRARLASGAFWSILNTGFTRSSALIASIVVARTVGRDLFGQFGVVQSTIGVFGLFAGLGMSVTATKYVAELRQSEPLRTGRILGLSILLAVISSVLICALFIATAPWLARTTLASTEVASLLRIGSGLLFFGVINGSVCGALYGFEAFKSVAIVDIVAALVGCGVVIAGVMTAGLPGAISGLVAVVGLQCVGYCFYLRRELHNHGISIIYRRCFGEWPVLAKFSLPALLAAAMAGPVNWVCSAIVVNQPAGYAQMGLFNAANQWRGAILLLPLTLSAPFLPVLSSLFGKERGKYFKVLLTGTVLNASLALLAAAGVIVFSRTIMASYGKGFVGGTSALICLVLSAVVAASVWSVGQAITSSGKMWSGFILNLIWAVALISSLWLFRRHGAYGYALANLIAYSIHLLTSTYVYSLVHTRFATSQKGDAELNDVVLT
jgi:O-antigen/teichoic acid export membrane protein